MTTQEEHSYEGVLAKIFEYLEEHLTERPSAAITAQSQLIRDLGLDSLQSFEMLSDLEDHYSVTIPMDLFQGALTLEDVARAVLRVLQTEAA
jgi:acyl carrier protein